MSDARSCVTHGAVVAASVVMRSAVFAQGGDGIVEATSIGALPGSDVGMALGHVTAPWLLGETRGRNKT